MAKKAAPAPARKRAATTAVPKDRAGVKRGTALGGAVPTPGGLAPAQEQFAVEYLRDLNATQAYIRTHPGCSYGTARVESHRLMKLPAVRAEIDRVRAELRESIGYDTATMLRREAEIAFADPRELVSHHVDACRHCYGKDHGYQRTAAEMARAKAAHKAAVAAARAYGTPKPAAFDEAGGIGYDPRRPPVADCPECFGRGVPTTIVHDTRHLSPAAAALYAGVKQTKDGLQVLMQDQAAARERLERHLGAFEKDNRQRGGELAEQLAKFVGEIHGSGAGRLPIAKREPKA